MPSPSSQGLCVPDLGPARPPAHSLVPRTCHGPPTPAFTMPQDPSSQAEGSRQAASAGGRLASCLAHPAQAGPLGGVGRGPLQFVLWLGVVAVQRAGIRGDGVVTF